MFRSINQYGTSLSRLESRKALYFLDDSKHLFFEPEFIKNYKINRQGKISDVDIVRIFSFLSAYKKQKTTNKIAIGIQNLEGYENYYKDYIFDVINSNPNSCFASFSDVFKDDDEFKNRFNKWEVLANELKIPTTFESIIQSDLYLIGLTYIVIFENKAINIRKSSDLLEKLEIKFNSFKRNKNHSKSPSRVSHLRDRIKHSITIYKEFVVDETA